MSLEITKEEVAKLDHNQLRILCRKKYVEMQDKKDYQIIK